MQNVVAIACRTASRLLILLGALNIYFQMVYWLPPNLRRSDHARDMWIYFDAAQKAVAGRSMYHQASPGYGPTEYPTWYVNPPQLASLITWFHGHPLLFNDFWYPLMVASFWLFAFGLSSLALGKSTSVRMPLAKRVAAVLAWGGAISLTPYFYYTMSVGNVEPVLWAMFAMAVNSNKPHRLLAVMSSVKPYAVWPLIVYSDKFRRSIVVSLTILVAGAVGSAVTVGAWQFRDWVTLVGPSAGQGTFASINLSLSMGILRLMRLFGWWHYAHGPLPIGPRLLLAVVGIIGPAIVYVLTYRLEIKWRMVLVYLSSLLFSPLCWGIYLTNLWVPAALLAELIRRSPKSVLHERFPIFQMMLLRSRLSHRP